MTTSAQASPSWSTARQVQVERRERDRARLSNAIDVGQGILDATDKTWISPRDFLHDVVAIAKVDQYTAQVVFDVLAADHKMKFVVGQGITPLRNRA
jgi:hypothetical protein